MWCRAVLPQIWAISVLFDFDKLQKENFQQSSMMSRKKCSPFTPIFCKVVVLKVAVSNFAKRWHFYIT